MDTNIAWMFLIERVLSVTYPIFHAIGKMLNNKALRGGHENNWQIKTVISVGID
jgi:hypothetical protein